MRVVTRLIVCRRSAMKQPSKAVKMMAPTQRNQKVCEAFVGRTCELTSFQ